MSSGQDLGTHDKPKKGSQGVHQQGRNWHVWGLMALGFFANSYSLCSMKAALSSIAFIWWEHDEVGSNERRIKTAILAGSIIGQLLFGYLADRYDGLKFYSGPFISLTFLTVYFAQSSSMYNLIPMMGLLISWGFFTGICNGAGHSLAATITAKFTPIQYRARLLAAVFLMQPLGQLAVSATSLLILVTVSRPQDPVIGKDHVIAFSVMDNMWRQVVVVGAVPACLAFLVRFIISKSPRYTLEADNKHCSYSKSCEVQSISAASINHSEVEGTLLRHEIDINEKFHVVASSEGTVDDLGMILMQRESGLKPLSYDSIRKHFWAQGNWRRLAGTSICWFLFGTVYSGLGVNNPQVLAHVWAPPRLANSATNFSSRRIDLEHSNTSTYEALMQDFIHMIIMISAGSVLGSIILLTVIDCAPRKKMLVCSFLSLAVLFAIAGGFLFNPPVDCQPLKIAFYIICQILCNLGPNALLFIISTEIFPACYRTTCHGISTSFGTFGSLLVTLCIGIDDSNAASSRWIPIASSIAMASGAAFTWAWIPEVQDPRYMSKDCKIPSKTLEALGIGYCVKSKEI